MVTFVFSQEKLRRFIKLVKEANNVKVVYGHYGMVRNFFSTQLREAAAISYSAFIHQ